MQKRITSGPATERHGATNDSKVCTAIDEMPDRMRRWRVRPASTLAGNPVCNGTGENIGKIDEIAIDIASGRIAYAVLSFGGALGIGSKLFAVPWDTLRLDAKALVETFILDVDRKTLENAPGFEKDAWPDMTDPVFEQTIRPYYHREP